MSEINWPLETIKPREVQLEALRKGFGKPGFAYFLRQRLGKTWLAYAEFKLFQAQGKVDWFFLICPNSIKEDWAKAIEDVDPYIPLRVYNSQEKSKTEYWFDNTKGGAFIINYESMKSFWDSNGWNKFNTLRAYICADESTKIVDPTAKSTKACLEMAQLCAYRRVLTGKPSKGSNSDLWAQLKFINATDRNFHQHKYYFTIVGGWQGKQSIKNVNTEILKREMEPYCYIAEDKYISGFEKIYEPLRRIEMLGEQAKMYKEMQDSLIVELQNDIKMTAPIILTKYLRLQQIASGIGGDEDSNQFNLIEPSRNPKIKIVKEIIENEVSNKVIIVCRFRLSIKNLYNELTKEGYKCSVMMGDMGKDITEQKRLFHEGDHDVCIAQEQVLCFGHTLHGPDDNPCTDMIFFENSFSLNNRAQCESRPENYSNPKAISYYDMYGSGMEEMILKALIKKEDTSMALMGYARDKGILHSTEFVR